MSSDEVKAGVLVPVVSIDAGRQHSTAEFQFIAFEEVPQ
jgi:hypothetical protein